MGARRAPRGGGPPGEFLSYLRRVRPAQTLGQNKGRLEPGCDADLVLVDLEHPYRVEREKLHSKSKNSPYDGAELYGRVCATIKGGKLTYQAGE